MTALRPRTLMTGSLTLTRWRRAPRNIWANYRMSTSSTLPTKRLRKAPPAQRQGLLGSVLSALQGRGVDLGGLQNQLGLPSLSPTQMGPEEYARIANYARRQHPDVMEEQVRSQPWFVKAMGNPIVMGALGVIASKLLRR
jgi:hypothetical protein